MSEMHLPVSLKFGVSTLAFIWTVVILKIPNIGPPTHPTPIFSDLFLTVKLALPITSFTTGSGTSGPVHTIAFSFENAYFFICFRLPSTLIRSKTEVYVCENGGFRKRSPEWRFLKTEVQRLCVDRRKRRFSVFVWTGENGDFRKRLRHWHWHVPVKKTKRMFFYPFSVVKFGRSKTLQKR